MKNKTASESHDFSCVMVNLPTAMSAALTAIGNEISKSDLAEDGLESDSHVTVLYGIHSDSADEVAQVLKNEFPIEVQLGRLACFPASGDAEYDVVIAEVYSPDLVRINALLMNSLAVTKTHRDYTPHATIAYVKPGVGSRFVGRSDVQGMRMLADRLVFSGKSGDVSTLRLGGSLYNIYPRLINTKSASIISTPSEFSQALELSKDLPKEKDGQPVKYFWKEVLVPGKYQDKNAKPFTITPARIDLLLSNFNKAKAGGFLPYVPDGHTNKAEKNFGFVVDARTNDRGGLELLHQLVGEDAHLAASRNKSSIFTVADYTDENGTTYSEMILHNAICPDPQLSNLRDFTPALAASRGTVAEAIVLQLASNRSPSMDMKKLRDAIVAGAEVTDVALIDLAVTKLTESKGLELSRTTAETNLATMKTRAEAAEAKVLELSKQPDLGILADRADLFTQKIDLTMERGLCVKAQADLLKAALKDGDKPNVLMLSRTGTAGTPIDLALKVLELNKPFTGTVTGQQMADPNLQGDAAAAGRAQGDAYRKEQLAARGHAA